MPAAAKKRQPGLRIRPGSVREAREEAGLSLGKVAGKDVSRTAIFLIEKGKARPTMATLELIAQRTGRALDFFLEDGAEAAAKLDAHQLDELERQLALQRYSAVIERGREILASAPAREDAARVRTLVAQAHIRLQQPDEADEVIAPAVRFYELVGNRWMQLECLATKLAAKIQREEPDALAAAKEALAVCRTLKPVPVDMEIRLLQRVAIASMQAREYQGAVKAFEEGLELAGQVQDLTQQAMYYGDLADAYQELGQLDLAARASRRALALAEMLQLQSQTASAENNLGVVLTKLGDLKGAEKHLERSLSLTDGTPRLRSHVLLSLAELKLAQGRHDEAAQACRDGIELAESTGQEPAVAEGRIWLGRILAAAGDAAGCDREFNAAIATLGRLNLAERATRAHAAYAEILEARGDMTGAYEQMKSALAGTRPDLVRREVADTGQISQLA